MSIPVLPGVIAREVMTSRLSTRILFTGDTGGVPVLFLHGNLSSATWWEEPMLALPEGFRGIAPDQRGFGESDPEKKIHADRGMAELAEDAIALLDKLNISKAHVVGNSMGGNVVWHLLMNPRHAERIITITLPAPGSPYGFGGTRDETGTPCYPDYAGSGGGLFSRSLVRRIKNQDMSAESPFSPRSALRTLVYKPPFIPDREDEMVASTLSVHTGPQDMPGDVVTSDNWPGFAPGQWGATNALSPKYIGEIELILRLEKKPPILWVRGAEDVAISDQAASDPAILGSQGLIKDYPGKEIYPPQPMLAQTRAFLECYREAGGNYQETVIAGCGHIPFIERPQEFNRVFHAHLRYTGGQ